MPSEPTRSGKPTDYIELGRSYQRRFEFPQAIACFRKAVERAPRSYVPLVNLGSALSASGRPEEAEQAFRTAVRLDPGNPDPYVMLGYVLQDRGQFEDAVTSFRQALERNPALVEAWFGLVTSRRVQTEERQIIEPMVALLQH